MAHTGEHVRYPPEEEETAEQKKEILWVKVYYLFNERRRINDQINDLYKEINKLEDTAQLEKYISRL